MLPLQSANPQAPPVRTTLALLRTFGSSPSTSRLSALQIHAPTSFPQQLVPPHTHVLSPNILPATQLIAEYMNAVPAATVAAKPPLSQEVKADDSVVIDSTVAGPCGYTDDLHQLHEPFKPISDPYVQPQALVEKNRRKTLH